MSGFNRREVCAGGLAGFLLTAFGPMAAAKAQSGETSVVTLASTKAAQRLDPHIDVKWEVLMILSAIYDTLIYQDKDGNFVPGLAKSWTVADDGLSYELVLRDDVHFQDNTPFDAEAVKFNFERIKGLGAQSNKANGLIADVESVEAVDTYTVRINMAQANGSMLLNLSLPFLSMVSPAAVKQYGDDYHIHQIGTGPYMFTEIKVGEGYKMAKNPDYTWGPSMFNHEGVAFVDELNWGALPEQSSRAVALLAGDFDVVFDLSPTSLNRVKSDSDNRVEFSRLTGQPAYWFLNTQMAPTDDVKVRQALITGVNMEAGVNTIKRGSAPAAHGPLSATTPEYAPSVADLYPYDVDKAKALLEEAGWVDSDGDGIREKDGQKLTLEVAMASWGNSEDFSVFLQSELSRLGVQVNLEMMQYSVQLQSGKDGTKNLQFTGGSGFSADDSIAPYFHSDNADDGFAFSKYKSAELDKLIEDAKAEVDQDKRKALYQQVQTFIMEKALILPIYDYALAIGVNNRIEDLDFGLIGLVPSVHDMKIAGDN